VKDAETNAWHILIEAIGTHKMAAVRCNFTIVGIDHAICKQLLPAAAAAEFDEERGRLVVKGMGTRSWCKQGLGP
jgi:hypothetical protein